MSIKVMTRVWEYSQAKHAELLIMLALADWSDDAGASYPSIPKLARKARLTERQTRRALNALEELAELRRQRSNGGRNRPNHYLITLTENPDKITLKKLQGKNYPEKNDQETLVKMSGALIRHRTVNKNSGYHKRREPADTDPRVPTLLTSFIRKYLDRVGTPYVVGGGKDPALLKRLPAAGHDAASIEAVMDRYFADSFYSSKTGFDVGGFVKAYSKLNSVNSKKPHDYEKDAFPSL